MEFRSRWAAKSTRRMEVKDGDLFVFDCNGRDHLAMQLSTPDEVLMVILAEFGDPSGYELPELLKWDALAIGDFRARLIAGDLVIEPSKTTAKEVLSMRSAAPVANGALVEFVDGGRGILLKRPPGRLEPFDLRTGKLATAREVLRVSHWKLTWWDGDDQVVLFDSRQAAVTEPPD